MGVGGQCHTPATFCPGKRPSTHCIGGLGGPPSWSGQMLKIHSPWGFEPWTIQPVNSCYTNILEGAISGKKAVGRPRL